MLEIGSGNQQNIDDKLALNEHETMTQLCIIRNANMKRRKKLAECGESTLQRKKKTKSSLAQSSGTIL